MPDANSVSPLPENRATLAAVQDTINEASTRNSQPPSTSTSRRTSQIYPMSPPPLPLASTSGNISVSASLSSQPNHPLLPNHGGSFSSVDSGGIPIRHPRPLTAAELHLELEKEQEAVVNRLTRELSNLRAQTASVASNISSATSGVHVDHDSMGATHPTSSRRHRSSSSVSRGSASVGIYNHGLTSGNSTVPSHRFSVSSQPATGEASAAHQARSVSAAGTSRSEEVAHYKHELDEAKRENEMLKARIRELERLVRSGGDAEGRRGRRSNTAPDSAASGSGTGEENGNGVPGGDSTGAEMPC